MQSVNRVFPFVSSLQTGNGSEQSIAHGLAGKPDYIHVILTDTNSNNYAIGTATTSVVKVTVTNTATYRVIAGIIEG